MERTCIIALVILVLIFLVIAVALSVAGYKLRKNSVSNPDLTKVTIENATILPTQGYNIAFWTIVVLVVISLLSILLAIGFAFQSTKGSGYACQT
jgi:hypothetical protein